MQDANTTCEEEAFIWQVSRRRSSTSPIRAIPTELAVVRLGSEKGRWLSTEVPHCKFGCSRICERRWCFVKDQPMPNRSLPNSPLDENRKKLCQRIIPEMSRRQSRSSTAAS